MDNKDEPIKPRLTVEYPPLGSPEPVKLQVAAINGERTDAPLTQACKRAQTSEDFLKNMLGIREETPVAIKTKRGWRECVRPVNDEAGKKGPRGI